MNAVNHEFLNQLDDYIKIKRYRLVNAVVVYENDELVFEHYYNKHNGQKTNPLRSVWKSLLSLTLGICVDKGIIKSIDEPIYRFLPQFAQNIEMRHKLITIRHLVTMSSGIHFIGGVHYHCPMLEQMVRSKNWISHIADVQMTALPGTSFLYKEWDVILLAALIGAACGGTAWDVANEYLYKPLGINDPDWLDGEAVFLPKGNHRPTWIESCGNISVAADLCARDMAKFGRLMLNGGVWDGQRIVSEEYIKDSIKPSKANSGYGYLWWLSDKGYHARGFGGQEINIYPDKNVVAVVQATVTPSSKGYGDICESIIRTI